MNIDLSSMPWWVTLIAVLASCLGSYAIARKKSNDGVQRTMLTQTVTRQQQLDERQDKMMDDLTDEINRLKEEQLMQRREILEERANNRKLSSNMEALQKENRELKEDMKALQEENKALKAGMDALELENKQLKAALAKFENKNSEEGNVNE